MPISQIVDPFASKASEMEALDLALSIDPDIEKRIIMSGVIADELNVDEEFPLSSYESIAKQTGRTGDINIDFDMEMARAIGTSARMNSSGVEAWANGFARGGIRAAQYGDSVPALVLQSRINNLKTLAERESNFIKRWDAGELDEEQAEAEDYQMRRDAALLPFLWQKRISPQDRANRASETLPKYEEEITKLEAERNEQIKSYVEKQIKIMSIPISRGMERFRSEEGGLGELLSPTTFGELLIEELTASSPSLVAMVGGSAIGGVGTGVAAGGVATMAQATSANFFGYLSQNDVDISNKEEVLNKLEDKEFFNEALNYAMLRSAPEAIAESLSFAAAGKVGSAAFNALVLQPGAAGLGAVASSLIVGEDPDLKDIVTEMLIELPGGTIEVVSQRLLDGSSAWKAIMMDNAVPPDARLIKKMVEATSMEEFTENMTAEETALIGKVVENNPAAEELVQRVVQSQKLSEQLGIAEEFTPPRKPIEVQEEELLLLTEGIRDAQAEIETSLDVVEDTVGVELEGEEMPVRGPNERDKAKQAAAEEQRAKNIEAEIQSELKEINEAIEVQLETAQPEEGKAKPPKELTKSEEASVSKLLNHLSGQGKKLTPTQLATTRERIRGDIRLAKYAQKQLKREQNLIKSERTKADARVFAEKEKAANKEERLVQKYNTLALKLRQVIRDLKKKHAQEVKEIKEEARQQARSQAWEESELRKSITFAIKRVEDLHKKLNAQLPKGNKLKPMSVSDLSSKVKIDTLENLLSKKLDNLESNFQKEIIIVKKANLTKEVESIKKILSDAGKGRRKTPWNPEHSDKLKDYLDLLGVTKESESVRSEALAKLDELNRKRDEQENYELLSDEDSEIIERSHTPLLSEDLSEEALDQIESNIKAIKKDGITARKLAEKIEAGKIKALSETLALELSKKDGTKADADEVARAKTFFEKTAAGVPYELATYQTIATILTGKKRSKFEALFDSISQAYSNGLEAQIEFSAKGKLLDKKAEELGIDLSSLGTTQILQVGSREMSNHEAMFVYGHNQNARGRAHLAKTNFGGVALKGEQIRVIEDALPQKYKDLVDFIIDYYDNDQYFRLNEIYKKRFGVDMPKEERYLPIVGLNNVSAASNVFADHLQYAGFRMGNQKFRTGARVGWGGGDLDLIGSVLNNIANTEHVIATYDAVRRAEKVLSSEAVRNELSKNSDKSIRWINKWMEKVARGTYDPPSNAITSFASHLRQNVAASLTALNLASWLKTLAPLIAIKKDIEAGAYADTMSNFFDYKKYHDFAVSASKLMATRRHTNRIEVAELSESSIRGRIIPRKGTAAQVAAAYGKATTKFKEAGWAVYGALDEATTTLAWTAKYKEVMAKTGDQNLAVSEADRIVNVYFPSGRIDQLPLLFTSGGLERQITVFTADMNRMLNLGYSITQLKDGKVQEAIMFVAFPVILSSLYLAGTDLVGDATKELFGREEEEERGKQFWRDSARYATSQFVGGIPFVGQMIEARVAKAVGDDAAAWFLTQNNMVFTSPFQDFAKGRVISAVTKASGMPGANYFSYAADRYLKQITEQDKKGKKSISDKWNF